MLKKIVISVFCSMFLFTISKAVSPSEVQVYRHAADQGDAVAQSNLGMLYEKGEGVRQDYAEAVKWYRLAAEKGSVSALYNLGMLHAYGKGIRQRPTAKACDPTSGVWDK